MSLAWAFVVRAGDGNRTRAVSLGIKWRSAVSATDLRMRQPAIDLSVPRTVSPHATCVYSWRRPPSPAISPAMRL
jgi:hypothetical protein